MIERDFKCIPTSLAINPVFGSLTSFQRDVFYSSYLAKDDRHCLPFDALVLKGIIFTTKPSVNVGDVAKARDILLEHGAFVRKSSPRKEWLEIPPAWRHEQGKHFGYGDEPEPPTQPTLPFAAAELPADAGRKARVKTINGVRDDSKQKKSNESPAPVGAPIRAMSREEDSPTRFARWIEDVPGDDLWQTLCETLGSSEMQRSGANWLMKLETARRPLALALEDYRVKTPASRADVSNRGAYLNERFGHHLKHTAA